MSATFASTATILQWCTSDTPQVTPDATSLEAQSCTELGIITIRGIGTIIMRVLGRGGSASTMIHGRAGRLAWELVVARRMDGLHRAREQSMQDGGDQLVTVQSTGPSPVPPTAMDIIPHIIRRLPANPRLHRQVERIGTAVRPVAAQCTIDGMQV